MRGVSDPANEPLHLSASVIKMNTVNLCCLLGRSTAVMILASVLGGCSQEATSESESPRQSINSTGLETINEAAQQSADFSKPGIISNHTFNSDNPLVGSLDYSIYTPASYNRNQPAPLLLAIHGCNTTGQEFLTSSALHPTAEREGIVVVYPDVPLRNEPIKCWQWFNPVSQVRGSGDPALLAGITQEVIENMNIDKDRVYALGMSSGAMMTSILGATYPDLYAAIAENAGCAYLAGATCAFVGPTLPDNMLGQLAFNAMGEHARVMPVLQLRGDKDTTVPISNSPQVINQWLATNNYVMTGTATEPFDKQPDATFQGQKSRGHAYTVNRYTDKQGCLLIEDWVIHDMGHFFSGGSPDPEAAEFTDPKGPMMAEISWRFFSRYKLSDFKDGYKPAKTACLAG